jgi:hypothetical protein
MRYRIEHRYTSGWDDAGWFDENDGKPTPTRFGTVAEAQAALEEHFADVREAVAAGDLESGADYADYRIVEAKD